MKCFMIIILFFTFELNESAQSSKGDHYNVRKKYEANDEVTEKHFEIKTGDDDDYDPGNPDNYETIVRPCAVYDRFCLRKFFAEHSKCKIVPGPVIEPYYVAENQLYMPNNNITTTPTEILFSGLNGRIEEFYVNRATGNLVLSVYFDGIKAEAKPTYLRFNRNGQEPVELKVIAIIDYSKTTVTIVIPNYKDLRLENAEINGFLGNPQSPFAVIPLEPEKAADPDVMAEIASLIANARTAVIENMPTIAPLAAKIFIQKSICDFGIPINRQ